jgi:AdoMet-dependent heme synthase
MNFDQRPFIVIWEVTQACDLICLHCRACAQPYRSPFELSTLEGERLIDQVAELEAPVFVLTGGDPLKRPDIYDLVEYATQAGVRTSMTPSATPLLTREAVARLQLCGLTRLALSLDGSTAEIHDSFRGILGSFGLTLDAVRWANELRLPVQIDTTLTRRNLGDFDAMVALLKERNIAMWSVFFLVPTGPEEFEQVFEKLDAISQDVRFDVKTTEAQHYRRFLAQQRAERRRSALPEPRQNFKTLFDSIGRAPRGINDGKGFVFISHYGEVYPSGFLPLTAGNVRHQPLSDIYRDSALFRALRNSSNLKGKCGACEFRELCGGSRSRAYALTGDPFAEDPSCTYQPRALAAAS